MTIKGSSIENSLSESTEMLLSHVVMEANWANDKLPSRMILPFLLAAVILLVRFKSRNPDRRKLGLWITKATVLGSLSEELSQIEVPRDKGLGLLCKLKTKKSAGPDGIFLELPASRPHLEISHYYS